MIRKFSDLIINEQIDSSKYSDIQNEIKKMIENTIDNIGGDFKTFIKTFNQNPEDIKIEGLINDSDIYDFYLKWRNEIDEILDDVNYYDLIPSENNIFGLYQYTIKGTEFAIKEVVKTYQ
jgi:hypothetical protein